ncbi:MAG: 50S ribosomal protein L18 [Phycisphaerales bacterium]|nr:MAG: 50S ribosomal protein L18 [Phycisphaerales bacterium]
MNKLKVKRIRRARRKVRVRKRVFGSTDKPRLTVFRSNKNVTAQLIDDVSGRTLVQASSLNKDLRSEIRYGGNIAAAARVGQLLAQRAIVHGIKEARFDRNGYKFHGRVKALADAAREAGLRI